MTNDELKSLAESIAAKEYPGHPDAEEEYYFSNASGRKTVIEIFMKGVEAGAYMWIDIEAAQPSIGDNVLVTWDDDNTMMVAQYVGPSNFGYSFDDTEAQSVFPTHWMPLPNPLNKCI